MEDSYDPGVQFQTISLTLIALESYQTEFQEPVGGRLLGRDNSVRQRREHELRPVDCACQRFGIEAGGFLKGFQSPDGADRPVSILARGASSRRAAPKRKRRLSGGGSSLLRTGLGNQTGINRANSQIHAFWSDSPTVERPIHRACRMNSRRNTDGNYRFACGYFGTENGIVFRMRPPPYKRKVAFDRARIA